jgi:hypothetical protein
MTHFSDLPTPLVKPFDNNLDVQGDGGIVRVRGNGDGVAMVVTADSSNECGQLWSGTYNNFTLSRDQAMALMLAIGRCLSETKDE